MIWWVWCVDLDELPADGRKIEAGTAEKAATRWAHKEDMDSADYWIIGGDTPVVFVLPYDDWNRLDDSDDPEHIAKMFRVVGETIPVYSAREIVG